MNAPILPTSPYAKLSWQPLTSCVDSVTPLSDILVINHQGFTAEISLYGGQVLRFQQSEQQPLIWLTEHIHCGTSAQGKESAIRGGVPICWPWFGEHPNDASAKHGFARNMIWQLDQVVVDQETVTVSLTCQGENKHSLYPQPFKLEQQLVFSAQQDNAFSQTLTMHNLSDDTVNFTGALHSYFQVSSPNNITIKALEQACYYDKVLDLDGNAPATLAHCQGPIDRIYYINEVMHMVDSQWQRTLQLTSTNCQQWVLWNPGQEGAATMADIHPAGEQSFVCLEAANTNWQTIAPQSSVSMGQKLSVS